ncbi:restriction endonuclease [Paenibacillus sp. FA6]|uniref:restriction endonuclease n=1 Tax=Paenibacillus sp. FA6 TaxID=3413029 RepID=UPI003F656AE4
MNAFRWIWEWSKRNLSNIFSIIGILLTIYFGVYFVPGYLQEMRAEKINTINEGLIENLQELIYNNQSLSIEEIESLIKAKEIKYSITYPYTKDELLIQISGRFLENKFIPLDQRKGLIERIQNLRKGINEPQLKPKEESNSLMKFLESLLTIITFGVAILGFNSTLQKAKRDRQEQIEVDLEERETEIQHSIMSAFTFEITVKEALNGKNYTHHSYGRDMGYDFIVNENNKEFAIQCKYYRRAINISEIRVLIHSINRLNNDLILVTNTQLTNSAHRYFEEYNSKSTNKLYFVQGVSKEDIKNQLNSIFQNI